MTHKDESNESIEQPASKQAKPNNTQDIATCNGKDGHEIGNGSNDKTDLDESGAADEEFIPVSEYLDSLNDMERTNLELLRLEHYPKCTYMEGYKSRQEIYSCLTCFKQTGKYAAVCNDCAYKCHEGHEIEQLYSKRNFRCDCGNGNFDSLFVCKIWPKKDFENAKNVYNTNFEGKYCFCMSTYSEHDAESMIQCSICEDWYHFKHIGIGEDEMDEEETHDLICLRCWSKSKIFNMLFQIKDHVENVEVICFKTLQQNAASTSDASAFKLVTSYRTKLCKCQFCTNLIKTERLEFLLDENDLLIDKEESFDEKLLEKLKETEFKSLLGIAQKENIVPVMQIVWERINTFSNELAKFVEKNCVDNKITYKDVIQFFSQLDKNPI